MMKQKTYARTCFFVAISYLLLSASALFAAEPDFSPEIKSHLDFLLENVDHVGTFGSPGNVVPFGENAAPLILGTNGNQTRVSLAAFSSHKKGRVIIFGHSAMIGKEFLFGDNSATRLTQNMLRWLAMSDGKKPKTIKDVRIAVVGQRDTAEHLRSLGCDVVFFNDLSAFVTNNGPKNADLAILNAEHISEEHVKQLQKYVENGGAILSAATGWGWSQIYGGKSVRTEFPANALFATFGVVWGDEFAGTTRREGYGVTREINPLTHPNLAMDLIFDEDARKKASVNQIKQATKTIEFAMQCVPEKYLKNSLKPLQNLLGTKIVPSKSNPIRAETAPLERLAIALQTQHYLKSQGILSAAKGANPFKEAAAEFPGPVPEDAVRGAHKVKIDTNIRDWNSTGLYAPPGETITVTIPEVRGNRTLSVRIGSHSDTIWHLDRWERYPEITLQIPLREKTTKVNNPFGGLIFIVVPQGYGAGEIEVNIKGAVKSPYFVQGKTTPKQWEELRNAPGPWAEIASDRIVLTVPSKHVRNIEDPSALLDFWNAMLDDDADLVGAPQKRDRPERITVDQQISAGYMHSGYPVMCHLDVEKDVVDLEKLKTKGNWGFFHEFGHNHQSGDWTFAGTGEVTVNLFSLYNYERLCGTPREKTRGELSMESRKRKKAEHLAAGAPFEKWKNDPFLALIMYVELIDEFGWDPFKAVFREYRNLPESERPRSEEQKRDQWMVRFSKQVGKNLGPFFQQWGVPTSQQARDSIQNLPEWLPKE